MEWITGDTVFLFFWGGTFEDRKCQMCQKLIHVYAFFSLYCTVALKLFSYIWYIS